jgi:hypothetical protein
VRQTFAATHNQYNAQFNFSNNRSTALQARYMGARLPIYQVLSPNDPPSTTISPKDTAYSLPRRACDFFCEAQPPILFPFRVSPFVRSRARCPVFRSNQTSHRTHRRAVRGSSCSLQVAGPHDNDRNPSTRCQSTLSCAGTLGYLVLLHSVKHRKEGNYG